jgi:hypothetical protein
LLIKKANQKFISSQYNLHMWNVFVWIRQFFMARDVVKLVMVFSIFVTRSRLLLKLLPWNTFNLLVCFFN